ncbi:hypothetical protein [Rhizobium grahamii]|uniref:Uncharacterized protein n=2 Tax=Rhizobium grahamii TaxID=1120045 RepID=S3HTP3_9HYPH|nr:hypothetical protein [Rhizobium grahamii]EPE96571.1 hypothetical protein RGCCGE502_19435 [Rhizobium grahamii CCGE 502]RDJ03547.1 hypothetical protein B5K06_29565 [Rhizobium grahamii]
MSRSDTIGLAIAITGMSLMKGSEGATGVPSRSFSELFPHHPIGKRHITTTVSASTSLAHSHTLAWRFLTEANALDRRRSHRAHFRHYRRAGRAADHAVKLVREISIKDGTAWGGRFPMMLF